MTELALAELLPLWRTLREGEVTALVTPALDYVGGLELSTVDVRFSAEDQVASLGEASRQARRAVRRHRPAEPRAGPRGSLGRPPRAAQPLAGARAAAPAAGGPAHHALGRADRSPRGRAPPRVHRGRAALPRGPN